MNEETYSEIEEMILYLSLLQKEHPIMNKLINQLKVLKIKGIKSLNEIKKLEEIKQCTKHIAN